MNFSKGILIATTNKGKTKEISEILISSFKNSKNAPINFFSPYDLNCVDLEVEENGKTFKDNTLIKARAYAQESGFVTLADDSGLEVDFLSSAPGVQSARYAGVGAGDKAIVDKPLLEMTPASVEKRRARFVCVVCVYDPTSKESIFAEGECPGHIGFDAKGKNGFGYDPVFIPDGYTLTMAELDSDIKNSISHRARALHNLSLF